MEEPSLPVKTNHLAACPEARINSKDILFTQGRGEQELSKVFHKDPDRFFVGTVLRNDPDLRLHRREKEPLIAVRKGQLDLARGSVIGFDEEGLQDSKGFFIRHNNGKRKKPFLLSPPHGKDPVRWGGCDGFFPSVVVSVFYSCFLCIGHDLRSEGGLLQKQRP